MKNTLEFSERLRAEIDKRGMKQNHLAKAAGVTEATICRYLNGTRMPRIENLCAIAEVLGCKCSDLIKLD